MVWVSSRPSPNMLMQRASKREWSTNYVFADDHPLERSCRVRRLFFLFFCLFELGHHGATHMHDIGSVYNHRADAPQTPDTLRQSDRAGQEQPSHETKARRTPSATHTHTSATIHARVDTRRRHTPIARTRTVRLSVFSRSRPRCARTAPFRAARVPQPIRTTPPHRSRGQSTLLELNLAPICRQNADCEDGRNTHTHTERQQSRAALVSIQRSLGATGMFDVMTEFRLAAREIVPRALFA